jgi:hypothetical protein
MAQRRQTGGFADPTAPYGGTYFPNYDDYGGGYGGGAEQPPGMDSYETGGYVPDLNMPPVTPTPGFAPPEPPVEDQAPVPTPAPTPQQTYHIEGLDMDKFNNPEHKTGKYLLAHHQSAWDPTKPLSEFANLLNQDAAFGGAKFRGDKDWLYIDDDPTGMFEGVKGADLIRDFGGQNVWQGWGGDYGTPTWGQQQQPATQPSLGGIGQLLSSITGGGGQAYDGQKGVQAGGDGGGQSNSSTTGGGSSSTKPAMDVSEWLKQYMDSGGGFNQNIVNRRVSSAQDTLNRQRQSRDASNRSVLAARGLIGSGPEITAMNRAEEDHSDIFAGAVNDIYANESENADQRAMQALSLATGMSISEAQNFLESQKIGNDFTLGQGQLGLGHKQADNAFELGKGNLDLGFLEAGNDFTLGQGGLALGNLNAMNNYNLGAANFGLNQNQFNHQQGQDDIGNYLQLLQLYLGGANTSTGGFF